MISSFFLSVILFHSFVESSIWLTKERAQWLVSEFERLEARREKVFDERGRDRASSSPFITGDGFRLKCAPNICDETGCDINPLNIRNGSCVFVRASEVSLFVKTISPRIHQGVGYVMVAHNSDLSCPDEQADFKGLFKGKEDEFAKNRILNFDILKAEHDAGRLVALHAQNLWWRDYEKDKHTKPHFLHCLPIGIENRYNSIGRKVRLYIKALQRNIIAGNSISKNQVLVAFQPIAYSPDRSKALEAVKTLNSNSSGSPSPYFDIKSNKISHSDWLDSIAQYRFTLTPYGNGLDTHRINEVLLMGGVPIARRSSIDTCYDGLPVVFVDAWSDLTPEFLDREWARITNTSRHHWDTRRLTLSYWLERIDLVGIQTNTSENLTHHHHHYHHNHHKHHGGKELRLSFS